MMLSVYPCSAVLLFFIGLHGVFFRPQVLSKILAANIAGSGVFLLFISLAPAADPVPQAMVLTGIVVALCFTAVAVALLLALAAKHHPEKGSRPPEEPL
jgi:multicomponent Na+:H+ antiporter subunit C